MAVGDFEITCINRWLKRCKNCSRDYNPEHKINNLSCQFYKQTTPISFFVKKKNIIQNF